MNEHVREDDRDELPPDEDDALFEAEARAEQAFELGADYGRTMGWYDEPDPDPWYDDDLAAYNANEADDYRHEYDDDGLIGGDEDLMGEW